MGTFDLTLNPFFLLGTGPRDNRERLTAAFEEAVSDRGSDEAPLTAALHALMLPLPRLRAELAWVDGTIAVTGVAELLRGTAPDHLFSALSPLAKANLAAHLCARSDLSPERRGLALSCLAGAQAELDTAEIAAAVNENRRDAGFPAVDETMVEQALDRLRLQHRDSAFVALMSLPDGTAAELARLAAAHVGNERGALFVGALVEAFDEATLAEAAQHATEVEAALTRLQQSPAPETADLAAVATGFAAWSALALPRRLFLSARLRDDPRSLALAGAIGEAASRIERLHGEVAAVGALRVIAAPVLDCPNEADPKPTAPEQPAPAPSRGAAAAGPPLWLPGRAAPAIAARQPPPEPAALGGWRAAACRCAGWRAAFEERLAARRSLRLGLALGVGVGAFALVVLLVGRHPTESAPVPMPASDLVRPPAGRALDIGLPNPAHRALPTVGPRPPLERRVWVREHPAAPRMAGMRAGP